VIAIAKWLFGIRRSIQDGFPSIALSLSLSFLSALLFFSDSEDLQSQIASAILFYGGVCDLLSTDANNPIKTEK